MTDTRAKRALDKAYEALEAMARVLDAAGEPVALADAVAHRASHLSDEVDRLRELLRKLHDAAQDVDDSRNNYPSDLGNRDDERRRDAEFDALGVVLAEVERALVGHPSDVLEEER